MEDNASNQFPKGGLVQQEFVNPVDQSGALITLSNEEWFPVLVRKPH